MGLFRAPWPLYVSASLSAETALTRLPRPCKGGVGFLAQPRPGCPFSGREMPAIRLNRNQTQSFDHPVAPKCLPIHRRLASCYYLTASR
ncbi:hypothetical protein B0I37DRAFT_24637 [Chaetomium sp. MPI-CAGE-AT-0009]|nr:hypothetical protein B0I37DRAFT_24637 [Chaetomium sp. MPI-CAGE-AT-0009]